MRDTLFGTPVATLLPVEYLPTMIAMTVEAGHIPSPTAVSGASAAPTETALSTPTIQTPIPADSSDTPAITPTLTVSTLVPALTNTPRFLPTRTPTITATPALPSADIQIQSPGPASRVVSPIHLSALLPPGVGPRVRVELLDENSTDDGPYLYRKTTNFASVAGYRQRLAADIEFELPTGTLSELGRLQIIIEDDHKRIQYKASVDLILLAIGESEINPSGDLLEKIILRQPTLNALIQNGTVSVAGLARPNDNRTVLVTLVTDTGGTVGPNRVAATSDIDPYGYAIFEIDVPFSITTPTWARLSVIETSDGRIPGTTHISTVEIYLSP